MTSGVARRMPGSVPSRSPDVVHPPQVSDGRPPWWALLVAATAVVVVTVDLVSHGVSHGVTERIDGHVSDVVGGWGLRDSDAYWPLWAISQIGGRGTVLVVLAGLAGWLAWRRWTLRPLLRIVVALALLTVTVYWFKWEIGRTAPEYPGVYLHHPDGESFPSGHVANAVLLWGVMRWQAVQYGMPPWTQRLLWALAVIGPVLTTLAMVALNFHWVSDAVVGAAVGLLLLGVVHWLDAVVLPRLAHVRWRRPSS